VHIPRCEKRDDGERGNTGEREPTGRGRESARVTAAQELGTTTLAQRCRECGTLGRQ